MDSFSIWEEQLEKPGVPEASEVIKMGNFQADIP